MTSTQKAVLLILGVLAAALIGIMGRLMFGANAPISILPVANTVVPLSAYIEISIDATTIEAQPLVIGHTNLPDGTILMITVRGRHSGYLAQDRVHVFNRLFRSQAFTLPQSPYNVDTYDVEVLMPYPSVQPESVRAIIGKNGEALIGPLVMRESGVPTIEVTASFEVPPTMIQLRGADIGQRKVDEELGHAITVVRAYVTNKLGDLPVRSHYGGFVVVELIFENLRPYEIVLRAGDFQLNYQDGLDSDVAFFSSGEMVMRLYQVFYSPGLQYLERHDLEPGQQVHGLVVFDNPRDTRAYVLTLSIPCGTNCGVFLDMEKAIAFSR